MDSEPGPARSPGAADKQVIANQTKVLLKKISSQRKDLDKSQFAEADKLLADIEKAADNLAKAPPGQKDKALVDLNKLSDALKDRREAARLARAGPPPAPAAQGHVAARVRPTTSPATWPGATSRKPPRS